MLAEGDGDDGIEAGLDDHHPEPLAVEQEGEVGEPDEDGDIGATGRSEADAPEIDGAVYLRNVPEGLKAGDVVAVTVEDADAHDLFGVIAAER